ncbi:MAG: ergothioneine biosynthesis protein EgtB [Oleiphilaceae bacterium]|nr:ergothioneine biosynthesis protein EgtB [Oleiphilaceae bacterium]
MEQELSLLWQRYQSVRSASMLLCEALEVDDLNLQAVPETSPLKWHLAHTTWFFETFLLKPFQRDYQPFHPQFEYLFNSYYNAVGRQFPRPQRHLLSRPTIDEVYAYRKEIDARMHDLLSSAKEESKPLQQRLVLGLNHEQQHQELMLTDLKFNWSLNPLYPVYCEAPLPKSTPAPVLRFIAQTQGVVEIGHVAQDLSHPDTFAFDNEGPRHRVWLDDFAIANRLTTNGEYIEFIEDGGYETPQWWTSDGWATAQNEGWQAPLYWEKQNQKYWHYTLHGMQPVDPHAPVCHVSLYEALAFASWKGMRLCRESEWEVRASAQNIAGHFQDLQCLHPYSQASNNAAHKGSDLTQLFGDVWEWTQSAYSPYPGYQAAEGALGEYNGKFMMNQMVLRGGSVATPKDHIRQSYRNFFYPKDRWQFSGIRLAHDG